LFTVLLEVLRPAGVWRMVLMPLVLVLLMLFRPRGIMGLRELRWLVPARDLFAVRHWLERRRRAMSLCRLESCPTNFGGLRALAELNLDVAPGELVSSSAPTARGRRRCSTW
jgi:branched-chain amino acid transport system permease protein